MPPKLGIIAGGGSLPGRLVQHCNAIGREVFAIALEGFAEEFAVSQTTHTWIRMGAAGKILDALKQEKVQEVVLVGPVVRPTLAQVRPDYRGMRFLTKVGFHVLNGDNSILTAVAQEFEAEGFKIIGIDTILDELLAPKGVLGTVQPSDDEIASIRTGINEARRLGDEDFGQAVVIQNSIVMAVEDASGTDALIRKSGKLVQSDQSAILVKMKRPAQDRRLDLPTLGVTSIENAVAAGLKGIAFEAGCTLLVDQSSMISAANEAGLFLIGVE